MKGKIASRYPSPEGEYTDLQVCKSAAGYYVGTMFVHNGTSKVFPAGAQEPGSRESEYFPTQEAAQAALDSGVWQQREHP